MSRAVFPGSFDPLTLGHLHLIRRAARLYDELIVVIAVNSQKHALFTPQERQALRRPPIPPPLPQRQAPKSPIPTPI